MLACPAEEDRPMQETQELTPRQRRILEFIRSTTHERGYPPTVREIGEAVGLTSSSSVHSQLENLQRKGYLTKDPTKPRAIGESGVDRGVQVPLVGRIAAGSPTMAEQQVESMLAVPSEFTGRTGEFHRLRVAGDSMTGAGIQDLHVVLVRQQDDCNQKDIVAVIEPGPREKGHTVLSLPR